MDILGICSIALDTLSSVDHLPIRDSFCTVLDTKKAQGGSGTNVLVQAQRVGVQTGIITKVSMDADSDQIIANLKTEGIDSRGVYRQPGDYAAPHCLIYIDPAGEKALVLDQKSGLPALTKAEAQLDLIDETKVVYIDLCPAPLGLEVAKLAHEKGKQVVLNIQDNMTTVRSRGVQDTDLLAALPYLDVFAPCQEGIKGLSGETNVDAQIKFIRRYYQGLIILTLGAQGLIAVTADNQRHVLPAYAIKAVDSTGAGDSFIGAFMAAYCVQGRSLADALAFSTACAAYTCLDFGAQASPNTTQVMAFQQQNQLETGEV